jgi:hypothetical protein
MGGHAMQSVLEFFQSDASLIIALVLVVTMAALSIAAIWSRRNRADIVNNRGIFDHKL